MFNGAGVLSATNAFESQNTVGIEDSHQNEDRKIGRGARQRKIPTLRDVLRRVGINGRNVKDSVAKTNWLEDVE